MALTTTEVAEFARRSRELMNDQGRHWVKGEYKEYDDHDVVTYCSVGAVRQTIFGDTEDVDVSDVRYMRVLYALDEAVREEHSAGRYMPNGGVFSTDAEANVIGFNDHGPTEWSDVERVFKRAEQILADEAA